MTKLSTAQQNAQKKYYEKNKKRRSYLSSRSSARSFIRNKATIEDLEELENLIFERKQCLLNESEPLD
ncbi:hypothetical protein [Enterococcus alishanensis]